MTERDAIRETIDRVTSKREFWRQEGEKYKIPDLLKMIAVKCTFPSCQYCIMYDEPDDVCKIDEAVENWTAVKDWDKIEAGRYADD